MSIDWGAVLQSSISAASGLGGVGLGVWLTGRRDAEREASRKSTESGYLAVVAVAHLDRFVNGCIDVAYDTGESEGRPSGSDGETYEPTVSAPSFDPLALNVDWKVLPRDLMYAILNLPYKKEQLSGRLTSIAETDDRPEYAEYFWARQHGFAELGIEVFELTRRLRVHAGLPTEVTNPGEWSREDQLIRKRDEVIAAREAYYDRLTADPLSTSPP